MAAEVEESLRVLLLTLTPVTAIVGTGASARIRPDRLHQGDTLPAIIVEIDNENHRNTLAGTGGLVYADVTLTCRADTKAASRALAEAVRLNGTDPGTGFAGYSGTVNGQDLDIVLDDEVATFIRADDGSDQGYYDVLQSYEVSFTEVI